jgi:branched-chain amino acid transport system substrate-binding protein
MKLFNCIKKNSLFFWLFIAFLGGKNSEAAPKTLKLGIMLSTSGPVAATGQETIQGIQLAIEEVLAQGDLRIETIYEDDKSDVYEAAKLAKKLVNVVKVQAIIGSVLSSVTNSIAPISEAARVPLLTTISKNFNITQKGKYVSRICYLDEQQSMAMARFAFQDLGARTAALLIENTSDYSQELAQSFRDNFKKLGGEILLEVSYSNLDQDYTAQMQKIRARRPDIVYAPGYFSHASSILKQARALGVRSKFLGSDGWSSPKFYEQAGDAVIGNYYVDHYHYLDTDPKSQEFVKRFRKKWNAYPTANAALGYDAAYVVLDAARRIKGPVASTPLMEEINRTKDFIGATGTITLDENRNAIKPLVILEGRKDGPGFVKRINP